MVIFEESTKINGDITMENYGTSPIFIHFSWDNSLFQWPFSIAMYVHQRVYPMNIPLNHYKIPLNHYKIPLNHYKIPLNHDKSPSPRGTASDSEAPLHHPSPPSEEQAASACGDDVPWTGAAWRMPQCRWFNGPTMWFNGGLMVV